MSAPQHCPGYEKFKELSSFLWACPHCGAEKEIFSDEFDREQMNESPREDHISFSNTADEGRSHRHTP
jgi:hypothetical protein